MLDDVEVKAMQTPAFYSPVDLDKFKPRTLFNKIVKPLKEKQTVKSSLSPVSYQTFESWDKT